MFLSTVDQYPTCFENDIDERIEASYITRVIVMVQDSSFLNSNVVALPYPVEEFERGCGTNILPNLDGMRMVAYEYLVPCVEECGTPTPSDQPTGYECEKPRLMSFDGDAQSRNFPIKSQDRDDTSVTVVVD